MISERSALAPVRVLVRSADAEPAGCRARAGSRQEASGDGGRRQDPYRPTTRQRSRHRRRVVEARPHHPATQVFRGRTTGRTNRASGCSWTSLARGVALNTIRDSRASPGAAAGCREHSCSLGKRGGFKGASSTAPGRSRGDTWRWAQRESGHISRQDEERGSERPVQRDHGYAEEYVGRRPGVWRSGRSTTW
jgi:hypothetical protein